MSLSDKREQKIGILGGTFDPIHLGHVALARRAYQDLSLDRVLLIPAGTTPHKDNASLAEKQHRLAMTQLAASELGAAFEVCPYEMEREGVCYTVDTLRYLRQMYPAARLFYICGSDILFDLPHWWKPEEILSLCELAVYTRNAKLESVLPQAELLNRTFGAEIHLFCASVPVISSTKVRELLQADQPCDTYVDEGVLAYIRRHGLYRPAGAELFGKRGKDGRKDCYDADEI